MSDDTPEDIRRAVCRDVADGHYISLSSEDKALLCGWLIERLGETRQQGGQPGEKEALAISVAAWERLTGDREHAREAVAKVTGRDRRKVKEAARHIPPPGLSPLPVLEFCRAYLAGEPIEQEIYDNGMCNLLDRPTRQAAEFLIWKRNAEFYLSLPEPQPKGAPGRPLSEAGKAAEEAEHYQARGWREDRVRDSAATMRGLKVPEVGKAIHDRKRRNRKRKP